jgi:hypothetical protein
VLRRYGRSRTARPRFSARIVAVSNFSARQIADRSPASRSRSASCRLRFVDQLFRAAVEQATPSAPSDFRPETSRCCSGLAALPGSSSSID